MNHKDQIKALQAEVKAWKGNHDHQVMVNAVLRDRPDLPVDRLPALERLEEKYRSVISHLVETLMEVKALAEDDDSDLGRTITRKTKKALGRQNFTCLTAPAALSFSWIEQGE